MCLLRANTMSCPKAVLTDVKIPVNITNFQNMDIKVLGKCFVFFRIVELLFVCLRKLN